MGKVLFIGIDAAEPTLIKQWMEDGSLPMLNSIFEQGGINLVGYPNDLIIHPWSNFYYGSNPGVHGVHHYIHWNADEMKSERIHPQHKGFKPWWRTLDEDLDVIAIDMPMVHKPEGGNSQEVIGWATHETLVPFYTHPPKLKNELRKNVGKHLKLAERYGLHTSKELLDVRDELLKMIDHTTKVTKYMMDSRDWDLLLVTYHSLHLGGHKFWNLTGLNNDPSPNEKEIIQGTLKDIYQAFDVNLGKLIEKIPQDTTIIVGSFHGMGASTSRVSILPDLISSIANPENNARKHKQSPGFTSNLRELIPLPIRHFVKKNLPFKLQDWMTSYWRQGGFNWSKTPAFALISDFDGYVRINLKGRERDGIVSPGEEYEKWISTLTEGILSYKDKDTGKPIARRILRREDLDLQGPNSELFPDLFIQWSEYPGSDHNSVISPIYGEIPWPTPGKSPDGRSGNHLRKGILLMNKRPKTSNDEAEITIQDVTATILTLLGAPLSDEIVGKSIL